MVGDRHAAAGDDPLFFGTPCRHSQRPCSGDDNLCLAYEQLRIRPPNTRMTARIRTALVGSPACRIGCVGLTETGCDGAHRDRTHVRLALGVAQLSVSAPRTLIATVSLSA
jgi:hypothetical protein